MTAAAEVSYDDSTRALVCRGEWRIENLTALQASLTTITWPDSGKLTIQSGTVQYLDSAGAWLLNTILADLKRRGVDAKITAFSTKQLELITIIQKTLSSEPVLQKKPILSWIADVGKMTVDAVYELLAYLSFIGELSYEAMRIIPQPAHFRLNSITAIIFRTGCQGLPIIALLSFMIGVVITFQMGLQLKNYGANIYIVDLLGLSVLREFAPLLTAIMVAGRTGSAYTAQLGMMKINQEIDALNTMGVTPAELLLLPRIIGLLIALPLLTVWADIFGVFGGMVMANNMLSITFYDFLHRFPDVIPLRSFLIGLGKAPVFALIISTVGCFQGMTVKDNADSVGSNTTRSVVLGIFFIIVADAAFSIIFSKLKL